MWWTFASASDGASVVARVATAIAAKWQKAHVLAARAHNNATPASRKSMTILLMTVFNETQGGSRGARAEDEFTGYSVAYSSAQVHVCTRTMVRVPLHKRVCTRARVYLGTTMVVLVLLLLASTRVHVLSTSTYRTCTS